MQQVLFETTRRCLTNFVLFETRKRCFTNLVLFETTRRCLTNLAGLPCCHPALPDRHLPCIFWVDKTSPRCQFNFMEKTTKLSDLGGALQLFPWTINGCQVCPEMKQQRQKLTNPNNQISAFLLPVLDEIASISLAKLAFKAAGTNTLPFSH